MLKIEKVNDQKIYCIKNKYLGLIDTLVTC